MRRTWRPDSVSREALRYYRIKAGLSQKDAGRVLSLGRRTVGDYELGRATPAFGVVRALAKLYGCEVLDLYSVPPGSVPVRLDRRRREDLQRAAGVTLASIPEDPQKPARPADAAKPKRREPGSSFPTYSLISLKQVRYERGMSQVAFASLLGCSPRTVYYWEKGGTALWSSVVKVARALRVDPSEIADPPTPPGAK